MSRYSKISRNIHDSPDFQALSSPTPNGQSCWLYLLTCRELLPIPGVILAGKATLAEGLRWPVEGFAKAFGEVSAKGMAEADWSARVVWIPNAWRHNLPESPNVLRSWGKAFANIPRTPLKKRIYEGIREMSEGLGEGFRKAFREGFGDPSPNQDQDQDQEQEQEQEQEQRESDARAPEGDPWPLTPASYAADVFAAVTLASGVILEGRDMPAMWAQFVGHLAADSEKPGAAPRPATRAEWQRWVTREARRKQESIAKARASPRGREALLQRDPPTGPAYQREDF
jgi:hypothetical protein